MYLFDKAVVGLMFQRDGHSWEKRDKRRIRRIAGVLLDPSIEQYMRVTVPALTKLCCLCTAVGDAPMQVVTSFSSAPGLEVRLADLPCARSPAHLCRCFSP
jgi:hypothetical protein